MTTDPQIPLKQHEVYQLFQALSKICGKIDQLLIAGQIDESLDDEQIKSANNKISKCRDGIKKQQDLVRKLRDYAKRKAQLNKKP